MWKISWLGLILTIMLSCREEFNFNDKQITNPSESTFSDFSIIFPKEGEIFSKGAKLLIKWQCPLYINNLKIEVYKKNDPKYFLTILPAKQGEYVWEIPNEIVSSVHYRVKISNTDNSNDFIFSLPFTIR